MYTALIKHIKSNNIDTLSTYVLNKVNKHKWYFIVSFVIFFVITLLYIQITPDTFTASTEIVLKKVTSSPIAKQKEDSVTNKINGTITRDQQLRQLTSVSLIETAIKKNETTLNASTLSESTRIIKEGLSFEFTYPDSNRVQLSLKLSDPLYAKNVLTSIKESYQLDASNGSTAKTAIKIINIKLDSLAKELANYQKQLKNSSNKNDRNDNVLKEAAKINKGKLKMQIAVFDVIKNYTQIPYTQFAIIPTSFDMDNSSLELLVNQLNDSQISRQKLLQQTTTNTLQLVKINKVIVNLKSTILNELDSLTEISKAKLKGETSISGSSNIDTSNNSINDLKVQQQGNSQLYLYLLHKRENLENSIPQTDNKANADSLISVVQDSKHVFLKFMCSLLLSVTVPVIILYFKKTYGRMTSNEILKNSDIPVLGILDNYDVDNTTLKSYTYNRSFNLQFHDVIKAIGNYIKSNVVIFTSVLPGEGKSFISRNIALVLVKNKKNVLLIRSGFNQVSAESFEVPVTKALNSYLINNQENFKTIINKTNVDHLSIIEMGNVDPLKYLNNERMNSLIKFASLNYDFVLIDSNSALPAELNLSINKTHFNFINILSTKLENRENLNTLNTFFTVQEPTNLYLIINNLD